MTCPVPRAETQVRVVAWLRKFVPLVRELAPHLDYQGAAAVVVEAGREALDSDRDVEAVIVSRLAGVQSK